MALSEPTDPSPINAVREQALDALAPDDDPRTVVGTVLRAPYVHHSDVRLDDVLELANYIDIEPAASTTADAHDLDAAVQQVLDRALAHLSKWNAIQQRTERPAAYADGNTLITESDEPTA